MLNQFFDQIYLINLAKRPNRRLTCLHQLNRLGIKIQIVEAVDGTLEPEADRKHQLSPGEYGYILTWKKIIETAKRRNYQRILCIDDDIWFHQNWQQLWSEFITKIRKDWTVIYLGASQHGAHKIDWHNAERNHWYHPKSTDGSFAVGLSRKAIEMLYRDFQNKQIGTVDSTMLRKITANTHERSYVAYPNLVVADLTSSDIRSSRDQAVMAQTFHWQMNDYWWQKMTLPIISVIVAAYQAESTIWNCLLSLVNQTYPKIEIIVIDDHSQDQTWSVIEALAEKLKEQPHINSDWPQSEWLRRIIIERQTTNKGCYAARNRGLELSKGELIAFQDADDVSLCYRLEEQARYLWQTNSLWTQCLILRTHLSQLDLSLPEQELMKTIDSRRVHRRTNSGNYRHCCAAVLGMVTGLYRRSVFEKVGHFLELQYGADAEFGERLLREYANVHLNSEQNVVSYLSDTGEIPEVFFKINRIMYLCHQMTANNLTLKYPLSQRKPFCKKFDQKAE